MIQLTTTDGTAVLINDQLIRSLAENPQGTIITFSDNDSLLVKDSVSDIREKIEDSSSI